MAATIYRQAEVDWLIAMSKRADYEAWENRHEARRSAYEHSAEILVHPDDDSIKNVEFTVEFRWQISAFGFRVSLKASIDPRPQQAICRYDVHDGIHPNPPGVMPIEIDDRQFHSHTYSEEMEQEFLKWDRIAKPIPSLGMASGNFERDWKRLKSAFLEDMKIKLIDSRTGVGLFGNNSTK